MADLILPLGIVTYITALITIISGLKGIEIKKHKILAYITIALATLHASLVIYLNYF